MNQLIVRLLKLALLPTVFTSSSAFAIWSDINLPLGVTEISREIYGLHMLIFWVCVVIAIMVYGVMTWSLIAYRKSRGAVSADFHDNRTLEWTWTILAAVILIVMAVPATISMVKIYDQSSGDITIKAVGYQWKWQYEYVEDDFSFFSNLKTPWEEIENELDKGEFYLLDVDNPVYVPIGKKIQFLITANDVLHAFWVRDLGIKQDAIPGYFNVASVTVQEPGVYRGVCAELCGQNHGFMPIVVVAVEQDEYDDWRAEQLARVVAQRELFEKEWTPEELISRGNDVYAKNCVACHQANGQGIPGAFPALVDNDIVLNQLGVQLETVINGVPGTSMQAFGRQLDAVDLAAVITYTRRSWGNESAGDGTFPLPKEIAERSSVE